MLLQTSSILLALGAGLINALPNPTVSEKIAAPQKENDLTKYAR
jgi:hypothetical protein